MSPTRDESNSSRTIPSGENDPFSGPLFNDQNPASGEAERISVEPARPDLNHPAPEGPAGVVSAETLRHPLTKKARKLLEKAQSDSHAGDHAKAIRELNSALEEPSAAPYAHSFLGVEYLKLHKLSAAIRELKQAAKELPRLSMVHSNLGLALCQTGRPELGLEEVDKALTLDQGAIKAHFIKGVILLDQGGSDHETWSNLAYAENHVPSAHLALAIYYARSGEHDAAQRQLESYAGVNPSVTLKQAQQWLEYAMSGIAPAEALGMWSHSANAAE